MATHRVLIQVSLAPQLKPRALLVKRWRRLELGSWPSLLAVVEHRERSKVHPLWFHMHNILARAQNAATAAAMGEGVPPSPTS